MHLGNLWNAYLNWRIARGSGGEFVLVLDDLCMELQDLGLAGYPLEVATERYLEDLEWMGLKPDRVERSLSNVARHEWATEKLGYRKPQTDTGERMAQYWSWGCADPCDFGDMPTVDKGVGWLPEGPLEFWSWYMACCIVDDHDFGITAWVAGSDQRMHQSWCIDAYRRLGFSLPMMSYHRNLKRPQDDDKFSKSDMRGVTLRILRESGYEPKGILSTLRECAARSRHDGLECILVPEGILAPEEVRYLQPRNRMWEELAAGKFEPDEANAVSKPYILAEAQRRLEARNAL